MGGFYLYIYQCDHQKVSESLNEKFMAKIADKLEPSERSAMEKLVTGNYKRDSETLESEDAVELIEALEIICKEQATKSAIIEFYPDDENLEEFYNWAFDDWDVPDDFKLPISPYGTPAVVYRNQKSLPKYLEVFQKAKTNGKYNREFINEQSLEDVIAIVSSTLKKNSGLFIFCFQ